MAVLKNLQSHLTRSYSTDGGLALLRIWTGSMMIVHGWSKISNVQGLGPFIKGVTDMGFPAPELFAWLAVLAEFVGGILIALGLLTRPAIVFMIFTMATAAFIKHGPQPFKNKELALTYLISGLVLFVTGPGRFSLDALLFNRRNTNPPS